MRRYERVLDFDLDKAPWRGWSSLLDKISILISMFTGIFVGMSAIAGRWNELSPSAIGWAMIAALLIGGASIVLDRIGKRRGEPEVALRTVIVRRPKPDRETLELITFRGGPLDGQTKHWRGGNRFEFSPVISMNMIGDLIVPIIPTGNDQRFIYERAGVSSVFDLRP